MASVEFIQSRISGKEKEIASLEKKIKRIEDAKATNWEKNPYYYNERDLATTQKELDSAIAQLQKYKNQLISEKDKAASRNVPAITEFLNQWEQHCIEYYTAEHKKFQEAYKEFQTESHKLIDEWKATHDRDEAKKLREERQQLDKKFLNAWRHVQQFSVGSGTWEENMKKEIRREKDRKYDFLIERISDIVGQITDAENLRVGPSGDLNGIVKGTKGKASVQTIGAGGWNIQVFHHRTLVKPVK